MLWESSIICLEAKAIQIRLPTVRFRADAKRTTVVMTTVLMLAMIGRQRKGRAIKSAAKTEGGELKRRFASALKS